MTERKSVSGVELIDGLPYFATFDGVRMNRVQWLEASEPERRAQIVADLWAFAEGGVEADPFDEFGDGE